MSGDLKASIGGGQGPHGYDGRLAGSPSSVVRNEDGSWTQTLDFQTITFRFGRDGSGRFTCARTYAGAPLNKTITATVYPGGAVTETEES